MGKLVAFAKKAQFNTWLQQNNNIDIANKSLNFILDTNELYTHGKYISGATWSNNSSNVVSLTAGGTTYSLSKDGHTHNYVPLATYSGESSMHFTRAGYIDVNSTTYGLLTLAESDDIFGELRIDTKTGAIQYKTKYKSINNTSWNDIITSQNKYTYDGGSTTITNTYLDTSWSNWYQFPGSMVNDSSYILQLTYGGCIYTGYFSYVSGGAVQDEIVLHCAGTPSKVNNESRGRLYARISKTGTSTWLQLASSVSESNAQVVIKYRKLL